MSLSTGGYGVRAPDAAGTSSFAEQACPGAGPQVGTELVPPPGGAAPGGASHELSEHAVAGQSQERRAVEIERRF